LPHPFAAAHRQAGYRYHLSILRSEFALTQVLDRPVTGRCFFEEVIRENLDLGRPDQMQLIFNRRITLRLHGLIERVPHRHRYRITPAGAPVAMFYARLYTRALRPACSLKPEGAPRAQHAFDRLDAVLAQFLEEVKRAA
jgi:hypothetical protein